MARKPRSKTASRPRSRSTGGGRSSAVLTKHGERLEKFKAKHGITGELTAEQRRQARGHKPAEHATRKERARAAGRLDENQRASVRRFAHRQARRNAGGPDGSDVARDMLDRFDRAGGNRDFERIKKAVARYAGMRRRRHRVRSVDKAGKVATIETSPDRVWDGMENFGDDLDVPVEWLYYH
jgi:hypothetical protein